MGRIPRPSTTRLPTTGCNPLPRGGDPRPTEETIRTDVGNGTNVDVVYREETRNVSDSVDVGIYDLSAYPYYAEYPNGDAGVAIFQSRPWQGYTLTDEGMQAFVVSGGSTRPATPTGIRSLGRIELTAPKLSPMPSLCTSTRIRPESDRELSPSGMVQRSSTRGERNAPPAGDYRRERQR